MTAFGKRKHFCLLGYDTNDTRFSTLQIQTIQVCSNENILLELAISLMYFLG